MAELEAIVADYLQQAAEWDVIPAAGPCCLAADTRGAAGMIDHRTVRIARTSQSRTSRSPRSVGRYIERRATPPGAMRPRPARRRRRVQRRRGRRELRDVLAFYEAMRASEDHTR